jgi:DNA-binding CsgD family transcriptional regulator
VTNRRSLKSPTPSSSDADKSLARLSSREKEIFRCISQGLTTHQVAERIGLSRQEVKKVVFRMAVTLGASTRSKFLTVWADDGLAKVSVGENGDVAVSEHGEQVAWISGKYLTTDNEEVGKPPEFARFLLLLVPKKYRENLLGDMDEEFSTIILPQYGARKARLWYWWQLIASIAPIVWAQGKRIAGLVLLWKAVK